jgi:class 3 adenylate cyclase/tetratricopeptide (TPR) repeat protein
MDATIETAQQETFQRNVSTPTGRGTPRPDASSGIGNLERYIPGELLRKLEAAREDGQMVGERRVVTMLFCDVKGSTAAAARFDPEEWAEIINGAFAHMIKPIYHYEGTVARLMGDGLLAFFGAPIAHEDDPQRAVLAGLEIIEGIRPYSAEMRRLWGIDLDVRVGVNTGLVVVGAVGSDLRMEYSALGNAINLAARMEQTAPPGTVQIAESTYRLLAPLFDVEAIDALAVKGVDEPVRAYRVRGRRAEPGSLRGIAGLESPLVGRDTELAQLTAALHSLAGGQGGIVSVMGEAGLGKSRLIAEARQTPDKDTSLRWIEGKSQSYETATPYAPFVALLAGSAGLLKTVSGPEQYAHLRAEVERLLPGRGDELAPFLAQPLELPVAQEDAERVQFLEPPMLRGRVFGAVATWIEALAAERPTVLLLDDIHWIDPTSLALLQSLLPIVERAPLLLLLAFRPRPGDPSWQFHESAEREYASRYTPIALQPLDEAHSRELVRNLLAIEDLPESVRQLILNKSEGNPFFLEEVIRSLLDAGLVVREGERWRATSEIIKLSIPDTLNGIITARLDRLDEGDKEVIQAAAVLGRAFDQDALADLVSRPDAVDDSLVVLQRRGLIRLNGAGLYLFKHALTQEAAYESLLLSRRRQLHHRAADSILRRAPDHAAEIARHYLAARQPAQALPHLVTAGHQAARAFATQEAIAYYTQALDHEALGDAATIRAAYEGLGGMYMTGAPDRAVETYEKMLASAEARGDTAAIISALNKLGSVSALMMGRFAEADAYLTRAEQLSVKADDPDGYAELSIVRCQICTAQADFDSVIHYMDGVIDGSLKTGNEFNLALGLGHTAWSLLSLNRFDDAWDKAQETLTLARRIGDRVHEVDMLASVIPLVHVRNGDLDAALASIREGLGIARRIGAITVIADGEWISADILRARGQYENALATGQRSIEAAMPLESFMPFYLVHPLGVVGTTYLEISEKFTDKIAEFHRFALRLLETTAGAIGGGNAWADLGWCALTLGDVELAEELFTKGLNYPTMMMMLQRPRHLAGSAMVQLAHGNHLEARRLAEEACIYAETYGMRNFYPLLRLTLGRVLAAGGLHEAALAEYESAGHEARVLSFLPILWQTRAAASRSLHTLGRKNEAEAAAAEARDITEVIAAMFADDELRQAYRESVSRRLNKT